MINNHRLSIISKSSSLILYSAQDFAPWRSSRADRATLFCVIGPRQFWLLRSFALFVLKVFVLFVLFVIGPRQFWLLRLFVTPIICLITGPLCGGLVSLKTKVWSRQEGVNRGTEWAVTQHRAKSSRAQYAALPLCTMHYQLPALLHLNLSPTTWLDVELGYPYQRYGWLAGGRRSDLLFQLACFHIPL